MTFLLFCGVLLFLAGLVGWLAAVRDRRPPCPFCPGRGEVKNPGWPIRLWCCDRCGRFWLEPEAWGSP